MAGTRRGLIGLGHDLQLISELEVASALRAPDVFFTSGELRRFAAAAVPAQTLAGGFAAKEALFKALPAGEAWFWTDAELIHDARGAPQFRAHGALASYLARRRLRVNVSISHSGGFASSVVILTGEASASTCLFTTMYRAVQHVFRRITAHAAGAPQ